MLDTFGSLITAFTPNNPRYTLCEFGVYRSRRDKRYPVEAHVVAWSPTVLAHTSRGTEAPIDLRDDSSLGPIFWLTTDGRLVIQSEARTSTGARRMIFVDRPDWIAMRDQEMLELGLRGNFDRIDRILEIASRRHLLLVVEALVRKARSYPRTIPVALKTQFDEILSLQPQGGPQYESAKLMLLNALVA